MLDSRGVIQLVHEQRLLSERVQNALFNELLEPA